MTELQLAQAGFYPISWPDTPAHTPGTTYVRPGRRHLVRVFRCATTEQLEVYAGELKTGRLVFRGPAAEAEQVLEHL